MADSIPLEVLTEIFQNIQNSYRHDAKEVEETYQRCERLFFGALDDEPHHRYRVDRPKFFSVPFMPSLRAESRKFGQFRLVSQRWKAIADTFFFRDIVIVTGNTIDDGPVRGYLNRRHRFLDSVLRGGYANLIRNIHLNLNLGEHELKLFGPDKFEVTRLSACMDLICGLLLQHSVRYLRLSFVFPPDEKPQGLRDIITNKIMDASRNLPAQCEVEISINFMKVGKPKWKAQDWLTAKAPPRLLLSNLSALEITISQPIFRTFFDSLPCTRKLHLAVHLAGHLYDSDSLCELDIGINTMPALQDFYLEGAPLLSVPNTLHRFSYVPPCGKDHGPDFLVQLCRVHGLQDLRLSLPVVDSHSESEPYLSLTDWSSIIEVHLQHLRILHLFPNTVSKFLTTVCSTILHVCCSLEEIKLFGVGLTNETILSTATRSLRKISLGNRGIFVHGSQPPAGMEPEEIQWSNLCTLFERNPRLSKLDLSFDLTLPPLTYEDIESISKSCPRLEIMELYVMEMNDDDADMIFEDERSAYRLKWLYSGSSATNDKVVRRVIESLYIDCSDDHAFNVDLKKFRRLTGRDPAGVNIVQGNVRPRRAKRG